MKISIFSVILLIIFGCSTDPHELLFNVNQLENLKLENIDSFWQEEVISKNTIDYFWGGSNKFKGGLELSSENGIIRIYVFDSNESAVKLTEDFRYSISMYTEEKSDHSIIKEKWWGQPNSDRSIFVNKFNTLITLIHNHGVDSNFTQYVAVEIMNRIKEKCE